MCVCVCFFSQALEEAEEVRRQALAKAAHRRDQELAEERERKEKLSRVDARNREEERARKAEEHRLQVMITTDCRSCEGWYTRSVFLGGGILLRLRSVSTPHPNRLQILTTVVLRPKGWWAKQFQGILASGFNILRGGCLYFSAPPQNKL